MMLGEWNRNPWSRFKAGDDRQGRIDGRQVLVEWVLLPAFFGLVGLIVCGLLGFYFGSYVFLESFRPFDTYAEWQATTARHYGWVLRSFAWSGGLSGLGAGLLLNYLEWQRHRQRENVRLLRRAVRR